jgi:hypothetical protein
MSPTLIKKVDLVAMELVTRSPTSRKPVIGGYSTEFDALEYGQM